MGPNAAKHRLPTLLILPLLCGLLFLSIRPGEAAQTAPGSKRLVSVSASGEPGNASSAFPRISTDGRFVAFVSTATNLVEGDTNGADDIFVYDLRTGLTERVSISSNGEQGYGTSYAPSISADGRFVAFQSSSSNLVSEDINGMADVFVRDRQSGRTELISVSSSGEQGNRSSWWPSISADGRFVAFNSYATNLVSGDTNNYCDQNNDEVYSENCEDIFVHDRQSGLTERVSVSSTGEQGKRESIYPSISGDGRFVLFYTLARNLGSETNFWAGGLFVHDRQTGLNQRVEISPTGEPLGGSTTEAAISADGRFVAFVSGSSNLVSGDTNNRQDIFVRDMQAGITERVSISSTGEQANNWSSSPSISADGRFVAFGSAATNLGNTDLGAGEIAFIHDRQSGLTELVPLSSSGEPSVHSSLYPSLSGDGRYVAFLSFFPQPGPRGAQIFVRDRCPDGSCWTGSGLSGRIVDQNGSGLADVALSVIDAEGLIVARSLTGSDGAYRVQWLPPGEYRLVPIKMGMTFFPEVLSRRHYLTTTGQDFVGTPVSCGDSDEAQDPACKRPFSPPFLELPFETSNFPGAARGYDYPSFSGRVLSWFDHAGEDPALTQIWNGTTNPSMEAASCSPRSACYDGHAGIDYVLTGSAVKAAAKGKVIALETGCSDEPACGVDLGNQVWLDHGNGYATLYGHLAPGSIGVHLDEEVLQGQAIGEVGKTDSTAGQHLHFQVLFDANGDGLWDPKNEAVDPYGWLPGARSRDPGKIPSVYLWKEMLYKTTYISPELDLCTDAEGGLQAFLRDVVDSSLICSAGRVPPPAQPDGARLRMISSYFLNWWRLSVPSLEGSVPWEHATAGLINLRLPYPSDELAHLDASKLKIYYWDQNISAWEERISWAYPEEGVSTTTNWSGYFSLQAPLFCATDSAEPFNDAPPYGAAFLETLYPYLTRHLFDIAADEDWVAFTAEAGQMYQIQTEALAPGVDTILQIYAEDGVTGLAQDDNRAGGKASQIIWKAPESGVYFVRVSQAGGSSFGCTSSYDLRITLSTEEEEEEPEEEPEPETEQKQHLFIPHVVNSQ